MKKVVYSVSRANRSGSTKMTGLGFFTDNDLIIACTSKNGKAYIRVFEDCVKDCHAVSGREGDFKGAHYEVREVEFEKKTSSGESTGYETREIEVEYSIWYKLVDTRQDLRGDNMNKREICDEHPTFAYYSGCGGLEVRFIEYGITNFMYLIAGQWSSKKSYHKLKIHSGNKYDCIMFHGRRCRLSDFIKI